MEPLTGADATQKMSNNRPIVSLSTLQELVSLAMGRVTGNLLWSAWPG